MAGGFQGFPAGEGSAQTGTTSPGTTPQVTFSEDGFGGFLEAEPVVSSGGSVTSVALTVPSDLAVAGSPITTSGTLAVTRTTQSANTGLMGPSSGAAATPTFRALVPADLPVGSASAFGAVKVDGSTITASAGVISASGGASDATAGAVGVVEIDQAPASGHPIALTVPRLGANIGVAPLSADGYLPSAFLPAVPASISEVGRWVRASGGSILSPTGGSETAVNEPCVLYDGGTFKMWFSAGNASAAAAHYATCPGTSDPTVAANWTRHGTVNQINVVKYDATYYATWENGSGSTGLGLQVATSTDGTTFTYVGVALAWNVQSGVTQWGNSAVWREQPGVWHMLVDAYNGTIWQLMHATSADGLSWTLDTGSGFLTTLQVAGGGLYGSPAILPYTPRIDGLYHLWYHACPSSGNLPTDMYHATSPDLVTWTILTGPILTHSGSTPETNQVADPSVLEVNNTAYLFMTGQDSDSPLVAHIEVCAFAGRLHTLTAGAGLPLLDPTTTNGDLIVRIAGAPARATLGTGLTLTGSVLSASGGGGASALASDKKTRTAGDVTISSTTLADLATGLDITITTGARRCLVSWTLSGVATAGQNLFVDVQIDGTLQGGTFGLILVEGSDNMNLSGTLITDALTAASHTFKLYVAKTGGTATVFASTSVTPAIFSVVELYS